MIIYSAPKGRYIGLFCQHYSHITALCFPASLSIVYKLNCLILPTVNVNTQP